MSSAIQLLQHLEAYGATIRFARNNTDFPLNPAVGQLTFVNGVLYIWSSIGGAISSWYPLNTKLATYVHTQGLASTQWTVTHDLGSSDVIFFVYNNANEIITAQISNQTDNGFNINFTEAADGRCVVFSTGLAVAAGGSGIGLPIEISDVSGLATALNGKAALAGSTSQAFSVASLTSVGNLVPSVNGAGSIGTTDLRWGSVWCNDLHVSTNTLFIGDTPFMSGGTTVNMAGSTNQNVAITTSGSGTLDLTSQDTITLNAPNVNFITMSGFGFTGDVTVSGNLTVSGTLTSINTNDTTIKDNVVVLNQGETGAGVSLQYSGLEIERGTAENYRLVFDESDDSLKFGPLSGLTKLATEAFVTGSFATDTTFSGSITIPTLLGNEFAETSGSVTTSQAGAVNLDTFSASAYRSAEVVVQLTQGTNYEVAKLLVVHNGSTVAVTEYGRTTIGTAIAVAFDAIVSGGNVIVQATLATPTATTIKFKRTALKI